MRKDFTLSTTWQALGSPLRLLLLSLVFLLLQGVVQAQVSKTYNTAVLDSFRVPAGVSKVFAQVIGAGGRGGTTTTSGTGGGGGGGGAYAQDSVSVTPGTKVPFKVGAGSSSDNKGDSSWFKDGNTVMALGGETVQPDNTNGGGTGGSATDSKGSFRRPGGTGATGIDGSYGGGGGSSASLNGDGQQGNNELGGAAPSGGGNGADGVKSPSTGNGANGSQPGGGGGGSYSIGTGGSGADGQVVVSLNCPVYSLTSTSASAEICNSVDSVQVTLTSTTGGLPDGIYKVTYTIDGGSDQTATFTVSGSSGSGSFYATGLSAPGDRLITVTKLESGESDLCASTISANNTFTVHVNKLPVITGNLSICKDSTTKLITDSAANLTGSWYSTLTSVATVDDTGLVTGFSAGSTDIYFTDINGCKDTITITVTAPPNAGTFTGTDSVCIGNTINLDSLLADSGGSWYSANTDTATVDASTGVVTGVGAGTVTISYIVTGTGGCANDTASKLITVVALPNAGSVTGSDSVCVGSTIDLDSLSADAGGTWVSGNTDSATVDPASGVVTGVGAGTVTIHYVVYGKAGCTNDTASKTLTVVAAPNAGTVTGSDSVCVGNSIDLDSLNADAGGTWVSANTDTATMDPSTGVVTGVGAGTVNIYYVVYGIGGCTNDTASKLITVVGSPNAGSVTGSDSVCVGSTIDLDSLSADAGGTWVSANTDSATVDPASGVVTGVGAGTVTIHYVVYGKAGCTNDTASKTLTVVAAPNAGTVTGSDSVCVGNSIDLDSLNADAGGTWVSADTDTATVDPSTGLVTGVGAGTVNIYYVVYGIGGCTNDTASKLITVVASPNAGSVTGSDSVCVGSTIDLDSLGADAGGTWVSGNTDSATVDPASGVVTGVGAGTVTIHYVVYGKAGCTNDTASKTLTVVAAPNAGTVTGSDSVCVGNSIDLDSLNADAGGTWVSANTDTATVDPSTGVVTGLGAGTVNIYYVVYGIGGCTNDTASKLITVVASPNAGSVTGADSVCVGSTIDLDSLSGDAGGTWVSGNIDSATVDPASGVVTGVGAGTVTIHYVVYGKAGCTNDTASKTLAVIAAPNAGTITGSDQVCIESTIDLDSAGADEGGTWVSANTDTATVDPSTGVVTGVGAGKVTIYYVVYGKGGCTNDTASSEITVHPTTAITAQPAGDTLCNDGATTTLSVTAVGSNLSYAWYSNSDSSYLDPSPGTPEETASSYTPPAQSVDTTIWYYVIVSGDCGSDTSDLVRVHTQICTEFSEVTTSINSPHSGVYSDTVWVRAHLVESVSGLPVEGRLVEFRIYNGDDPSIPTADVNIPPAYTDANGFARSYITITQDPDWTDDFDDRNGDDMHIRAYFAGDESYGTSERVENFNVRKEVAEFVAFGFDANCVSCADVPDAKKIKFNGKTGSGYIVTPNNTVDVTIQVKIKDETDGMPGDISKANVRFELNPSGSTTPLVKYGRPSTTDSTVTVTFNGLSVGSYGSNSFTVHVTIGDYYRGRLNSTLTIHKKGVVSLFSGGGDILIGSSGGKYTADPGTLTSFSVGSKYNKTASKVQGKASLIFTSKGRTYMVTGSGVPKVTFDSVGGVASYVTAASMTDITLDITGVVSFTGSTISSNLTMTYNLKDSTTDLIAVKVAEGATLWFSNKGTGSVNDRQSLIRGGMTISSSIASPTASSVSRCGPGSVTLTATPPSGATIDWYDAPTGGTRLSTGSNSYSAVVSATTIFYAEARNTLTSAVSATRTPATVTINAQPDAPVTSGGTRCGSGTVVLSAQAPANASLAWYSAASGGSALSTAASFTTPSISTTTKYYVEAKSTLNGCVSATRTAATATVNALPTVTAAPGTSCGPGVVTLIGKPSAGAQTDWYSASTGGSLLKAASDTFSTPYLTASTTYYISVKNTTTGCVSSTRTAVSATISSIPAAPASISGTVSTCPTSAKAITFTAAKVTGAASYIWTKPSCATGSSTTNTISLTFSKAGSNDSVYVRAVNSSGCVSAARGVKVTTATTCTSCAILTTGTGTRRTGSDQTATEYTSGLIQMKAYPNPNTGAFNLSLKGFDEGLAVVKVMDMYGSVIYTRQVTLSQNLNIVPVDIRSVAKGVYLIQVVQKDKVNSLKLSKE